MSFNATTVGKYVSAGKTNIVDGIVNHLDDIKEFLSEDIEIMCHFFAHMKVESSNFRTLEENLNYSASRLVQVWPRRFPSISAATPYSHNPQKLANKVYGGRLGNTEPNDGWEFRGSGLLQITGRYNVEKLADILDVEPEECADMIRNPDTALKCAAATYHMLGADKFTDISRSTKAVNGGLNGLSDRKIAYSQAKRLFEA